VSCAGEGHHACALHGGRCVYSGEIEDCGGDVYVEDHLVADDAGVDAFGVADHHGDADGGLVHEALVEETPLAEEIAVVGAVDDGGVVHLVGGFEVCEDAADVFVDGDEAGVVVLAELFERADGVLCVECADLVVGVDEGLGFAGVALEVVVEGGRLGDGDAVVEIEMAAGAEEGCVRGLVPEAEAEGLVAVVFFQPGDGLVGDDVVGVAVVCFFGIVDAVAAFDEAGLVVVGGGGVEAEVVVPVAIFDAIADVGFAEHRGLVAGVVEEIGEDGDVGWQWGGGYLFVVECAGGAGPEAGKSCCAGRGAESVGAEGVAEADALAADAVLVRSLEDGMAGDAERVCALAFGVDEEQVGALGSRGRGGEC